MNFSGGSSETVIYEATVLASNILYIKNTQAIQTPEIVFQVGSTEIIDMEENTTRIKNKLSVENNIIECLPYGSNVNISTAVKFQKQGNDFITFDNDNVNMIKPMEGTTLNLTGKITPLSVECFLLLIQIIQMLILHLLIMERLICIIILLMIELILINI